MPLTLLWWWKLESTLASALCAPTSLGNPRTTLMFCELLIGKPVPLQVTDEPVTVHPEICWLVALIGTSFATRSAIAFGMLLPQSPTTNGEVQFSVPGAGSAIIEGVLTV